MCCSKAIHFELLHQSSSSSAPSSKPLPSHQSPCQPHESIHWPSHCPPVTPPSLPPSLSYMPVYSLIFSHLPIVPPTIPHHQSSHKPSPSPETLHQLPLNTSLPRQASLSSSLPTKPSLVTTSSTNLDYRLVLVWLPNCHGFCFSCLPLPQCFTMACRSACI